MDCSDLYIKHLLQARIVHMITRSHDPNVAGLICPLKCENIYRTVPSLVVWFWRETTSFSTIPNNPYVNLIRTKFGTGSA